MRAAIQAAAVTIAAVALSGCAGGGKVAEEQHRREHPCQFSATSKQCAKQRSAEKRGQEARRETGALRERAREEAESARLRKELGQ
jgi:hypothetical protein